MITASRIVKRSTSRRHSTARARLAGGRWNLPGTALVYTSGSAALAALEMLVHLRPAAPPASYVLIGWHFDESLVMHLDRAWLPHDRRSYPAPAALQRLGDEWLRQQRTAVREVPSAIIETESTYLLNPAHRAFRKIEIGEPRAFVLEPRLLAESRA